MMEQKMPETNGNQWQLNYSTIGDSIGHFFLNEDGADIWFVPLLNAADPPKKFPAHKLILKCRSPVFYAQFIFDQLKKKTDESKESEEDSSNAPAVKKPKIDESQDGIQEIIELSDIEPEAFEQFLRFCYTDKAEIAAENVTSILYTANRYNVRPLMNQTLKFICENVKVENAFEMLQFAKRFDYDGIREVEKCALEIIRAKTVDVVKTEAFLEISPEMLELIVSQDQLAIKQVDLFQQIIRWAKKRKMIAGNEGKSLRELLGPALFHIQFWQMNIEDFGRFVVPKNVLTDKETIYVFKKLSTHEFDSFYADPECPFPRFGIHQKSRIITFEIIDARKFAEESERWEWSEPHCINGYTFRIMAGKKQSALNFGVDIYCTKDGSENWNYKPNMRLTLVNKKPGKRNITTRASYPFSQKLNAWGNYNFIGINQLLDPENGWIDEDDTVTLKLLIEVTEKELEEHEKGKEIEK